MRVAFGVKAHSGWAALVAVAKEGGAFSVVARSRLELVAQTWQKAPYHAAEKLGLEDARPLVERGIAAARRGAVRAIESALQREHELGHGVDVCAVLTGSPMPAWTTEEILAVHFRMHQAEGTLFRDALCRAARECGLRLVEAPEKRLLEDAAKALGVPASRVPKELAALGKGIGPPWGKDQKDAALGAMIALSAP